MKQFLKNLLAVFAISLIIISVITLFLGAISNVDDEKALKDKTQLENALKNAAVSCYAIEGTYPPSAEYLIENEKMSGETFKQYMLGEEPKAEEAPEVVAPEITTEIITEE
jgi:hypothetical protein